MVMPSNNTGLTVGHMAGRFPERIGLLMSPGGWRRLPSWMPYAVDNGAYSAWVKQTPWDAKAFREHLAKVAAAERSPLWVVVPDVVMDKKATLGLWRKWAPLLRKEHPGFRLAFAVQDGMSEEDVPSMPRSCSSAAQPTGSGGRFRTGPTTSSGCMWRGSTQSGSSGWRIVQAPSLAAGCAGISCS